jgi:predicted nucleic acid-binding protein
MVRIVLDTGVFYYPETLRSLVERPETIIVPAVALAERVRQLARDGRSEEEFLRTLDDAGYLPEPLAPEAACEVSRRVRDDAKWARLSRDAFIAAHVEPGDELWTTNPRDFKELGVPDFQIVSVPS